MEIKEGEYTIFKNGKLIGVITHKKKGPAVLFVSDSALTEKDSNEINQKLQEINLAAYSRG